MTAGKALRSHRQLDRVLQAGRRTGFGGAIPAKSPDGDDLDDPFGDLPGLTSPGMKKVVFHGRRGDITVGDYGPFSGIIFR